MWLLKGNEHAASDVMTQKWSKYAHLKTMLSVNCFKSWKRGMPLHVMHTIISFSNSNAILPIWNPKHYSHPINPMKVPP